MDLIEDIKKNNPYLIYREIKNITEDKFNEATKLCMNYDDIFMYYYNTDKNNEYMNTMYDADILLVHKDKVYEYI